MSEDVCSAAVLNIFTTSTFVEIQEKSLIYIQLLQLSSLSYYQHG